MGKLMLIITALSLCACAGYDTTQINLVRDERVAHYVSELEAYYGFQTQVNIKIVSLGDEGRAVCDMRSHTIYIDSAFYSVATTANLEEVVLHEFGHCVFNKGHYGIIIVGGAMHGCLSSVMHPDALISNTPCWNSFKNYYKEELK